MADVFIVQSNWRPARGMRASPFTKIDAERRSAANIYGGAMPEGLLIAGFPRIVSLPLEGKVPQRGG